MKYYETPYVTVTWEENYLCVHTQWHGPVPSDEFRSGLLKGLELVLRKHASLWVSDIREMHVVSTDDQQWISKVFYPRLVSAGIKKLAFVKPARPVTLMSVHRIVKQYDEKKLRTGFFNDLATAYAWLVHDIQPSKDNRKNNPTNI